MRGTNESFRESHPLFYKPGTLDYHKYPPLKTLKLDNPRKEKFQIVPIELVAMEWFNYSVLTLEWRC